MKKILYGFLASSLLLVMTGCKKEKAYEIIEDKVYFGYYPQTLVSDEKIVNKINKRIDKKKLTWSSYNYPSSDNTDIMQYIDVDLNGDKKFDYRGVKIAKYRTGSQTNFGYLDENKETYWFKYELIEWDIIDEGENELFLLANLALDSHEFCSTTVDSDIYFRKFEHNGGLGYYNDYALSDIRKWLNDTFYTTAFNAKRQKLIKQVEVDNSSFTYGDIDYNSTLDNTHDKIFLLSIREFIQLDESLETCGATDYAKCQGAFVNVHTGKADWLSRSASVFKDVYQNDGTMYVVNFDGNAEVHRYSQTTDQSCSIRPALWLKIEQKKK